MATPAKDTRPLPPLEVKERIYLSGLFKAYVEGRDKLPKPWVVAGQFKDAGDSAVVAKVTALVPIQPSKSVVREEPWLVRGVLRANEQGPPSLTRVSVEHFTDPAAEVTGTVLHRLPLATIRNRALAWLDTKSMTADVLQDVGYRVSPAEKRWARRVTTEARKQPLVRGRQGYPVDHYRRIALRAVELFGDGKQGRRDVLAALADEEDRPYQTIRDWVHRARSLGFLEPTKQGRSAFRPGPDLYRKEAGDV